MCLRRHATSSPVPLSYERRVYSIPGGSPTTATLSLRDGKIDILAAVMLTLVGRYRCHHPLGDIALVGLGKV